MPHYCPEAPNEADFLSNPFRTPDRPWLEDLSTTPEIYNPKTLKPSNPKILKP